MNCNFLKNNLLLFVIVFVLGITNSNTLDAQYPQSVGIIDNCDIIGGPGPKNRTPLLHIQKGECEGHTILADSFGNFRSYPMLAWGDTSKNNTISTISGLTYFTDWNGTRFQLGNNRLDRDCVDTVTCLNNTFTVMDRVRQKQDNSQDWEKERDTATIAPVVVEILRIGNGTSITSRYVVASCGKHKLAAQSIYNSIHGYLWATPHSAKPTDTLHAGTCGRAMIGWLGEDYVVIDQSLRSCGGSGGGGNLTEVEVNNVRTAITNGTQTVGLDRIGDDHLNISVFPNYVLMTSTDGALPALAGIPIGAENTVPLTYNSNTYHVVYRRGEAGWEVTDESTLPYFDVRPATGYPAPTPFYASSTNVLGLPRKTLVIE